MKPITGRKHQLRKQLFNIGHPIYGDQKYKSQTSNKGINKNLMLHSYQLKFIFKEKKYTYKALLPDYFRKLLKTKGLEDNTVIIWMGDNGYFLGERQMAGKWLMYDNSVRVPLIIFDPRVKQHYDVGDIVANVDLASTILDFAGVDSKLKTQGNSLLPYVKTGKSPFKRNTLLIEHLWDFDPMIFVVPE